MPELLFLIPSDVLALLNKRDGFESEKKTVSSANDKIFSVVL